MEKKELIRIDILSAVPDIFTSVMSSSMIRIAQEREIAKVVIHDLHDYSDNKFGHIDDTPFGGGAGMLIKCQPIFDCIEKLLAEREYDEILFPAADGEAITQSKLNELSLKGNIMIICGHYKGIDQRIRDKYVTREFSVGDYVLSGGEIPAMLLTDGIIRLLPGVMSDIESALEDSFMDDLLEAPQYTRPAEYEGMKVPDVLLTGHHKNIKDWQLQESLKKTKALRPDLYKKYKDSQ
jgi:tRNA (guanine37-N1)-methyltransferase